MKHLPFILTISLLAQPITAHAAPTLPPKFKTITITSSLDQSKQHARILIPNPYKPANPNTPRPLLVLLHTWSADYRQAMFDKPIIAQCTIRNWVCIMPNFRGPNIRPQACASKLAVRDVLDAIQHTINSHNIDTSRIYLVGTSGGGHMALAMAHRAPRQFAAVSAWVPISDLVAWHAQTKAAKRHYYKQIEKCTGGPPGASPAVDAQYNARSPIHHLAAAKNLPIDINTGIHDGHTGSVPVSHSLHAFNVLAKANNHVQKQISQNHINHITRNRAIPKTLIKKHTPEPNRRHPILFRRSAGPVRITISSGGHEGDMPTALHFLAKHQRKSTSKKQSSK